MPKSEKKVVMRAWLFRCTIGICAITVVLLGSYYIWVNYYSDGQLLTAIQNNDIERLRLLIALGAKAKISGPTWV